MTGDAESLPVPVFPWERFCHKRHQAGQRTVCLAVNEKESALLLNSLPEEGKRDSKNESIACEQRFKKLVTRHN